MGVRDVKEKVVSLAHIEAKLDTVIRLLALSAISDHAPLREHAVRLKRAGLAPKEIAALCDTTPNTVSVALSTAKRGKRRRKATR
jgi:DNA-binding NarL/FixJ family response regulator